MRHRSSFVKSAEAAPGAPSADDPYTLLFDVWLVGRATLALLEAAIKPSGLTAEDFAIYSVLRAAGPLTPTQLAEWMAAAPTTVSSYVKRYESRGHVRRERNPADGRSSLLVLTRKGVNAQGRAARLYVPALERVRGELRIPEGRVRASLVELRRALDAAAGPSEGSQA